MALLHSHLLAAALAGFGLVGVVFFTSGSAPTAGQKVPQAPQGDPQAKESPWPPAGCTDALSDALPDGATLRLGTGRFRNNYNIGAVAFSADGKVLASASSFDDVRLWHVPSGKLLGLLPAPTATRFRTYSLAFSPDGKYLATGEFGNTVRLWDWTKKKILWEKTVDGNNEYPISGLAFSPDSKLVASVGARLWVWEAQSGMKRLDLPLGKDGNNGRSAVAFSSDGKLLAVSSASRVYVVSLAHKGKPVEIPIRETSYITSLAFLSPRTLAVSLYDDGISYWDATSGKLLRTLAEKEPVFGIAVSHDRKLIAGRMLTRVTIWDTANNKVVRHLFGHRNSRLLGQQEVAFSPDGKYLAVCGFDLAVHLWDLTTGKYLLEDTGHASFVSDVRFSPDGKFIFTASHDGSLGIWDAQTGARRRTLLLCQQRTGWINGMAVSPDGCHIAAAGYRSVMGKTMFQGLYRVWDVASGKELAAENLPGDGGGVAFTPDNRTLVVTSGSPRRVGQLPGLAPQVPEELAQRWDERLGRTVVWIKNTQAAPFPSPDGKRVSAAGRFGNLAHWDLVSGKKHDISLKELTNRNYSVRYSPTHSVAAINPVFSDELLLVDMTSGDEEHRLKFPGLSGMECAFSPDERLLAVASSGYVFATASPRDFLQLYELATLRKIVTLRGGGTRVVSLAFSPDGKRLVSGMQNGTALVWDLGPLPSRAKVTEKEVAQWWEDLASQDTRRAYLSLRTLVGAAEQTVAFVDSRLKPNVPVPEDRLQKLISDLDKSDFRVRSRAEQELRKLGSQAFGALRQAIKNKAPLEQHQRIVKLLEEGKLVREPETIRRLRAIMALEWIATPSARRILQRLAEGDPLARETAEARKSLARLKGR